MLKIGVGIIGCGAIGREICKAIDDEKKGLEMELRFLIDKNPERVERLCNDLKKKPEATKYGSIGFNFNELLGKVDLVIECASQSAVREFVIPALRKGKDVMILSVGALCDAELFDEVERISKEERCNVYIPSGAIAGIDGLKSGAVGELYSVELTTRKPPSGFEGNEYVKKKGVDLPSIKKETILFSGSAEEAVRHFPENVNVAASLSIAGIGSKRTIIKVIADPFIEKNVHKIEASGEFGFLFVRVENIPSPRNPKTSYLAALSAIATLKSISYPIRVGT